MRTIKTALAVTLSLMVVEYYGASTAKVVFATIGAISAVGPTFTASLLACMTQICGVTVGALLAMALMALHPPGIVGVGIGIIVIITSYHHLKLKLVPVLPSLVVVQYLSLPPCGGAAFPPGAPGGPPPPRAWRLGGCCVLSLSPPPTNNSSDDGESG